MIADVRVFKEFLSVRYLRPISFVPALCGLWPFLCWYSNTNRFECKFVEAPEINSSRWLGLSTVCLQTEPESLRHERKMACICPEEFNLKRLLLRYPYKAAFSTSPVSIIKFKALAITSSNVRSRLRQIGDPRCELVFAILLTHRWSLNSNTEASAQFFPISHRQNLRSLEVQTDLSQYSHYSC